MCYNKVEEEIIFLLRSPVMLGNITGVDLNNNRLVTLPERITSQNKRQI